MSDKNQLAKDIDSTTPDELDHFHHHFSITMELDKHPLMMAMGAIAILLLIYYVYKQGIITKSAVSSSTQSLNNTAGQPIPINITVPSPTTGTPTTAIPACKPGFHFQAYIPNGNVGSLDPASYGVSGGYCVPDSPTIPSQPVTTPSTTYKIRSGTGTYGNTGIGGVPADNSPGGTVITVIPYGTSITPLGFTTGPTNSGNQKWWQVQYNGNTAFVSDLDVVTSTS